MVIIRRRRQASVGWPDRPSGFVIDTQHRHDPFFEIARSILAIAVIWLVYSLQ